jgi:hypothetical protein
MAVELVNFPYCCTAKVLVNFGESEVAEGGDFYIEKKNVVDRVKARIKFCKDNGYAVVVATTNDEQTTTNEVLEELGFLSSDWMEKDEHPETMVKLWWYPIKRKEG